MKVSVDISYYPLDVEYIPPIKDFIDRINAYNDLRAVTNGLSTQVFGDYKYVMNAITNEIEKSFEIPHSVFILKVINADLQVHNSVE